MGKYHNNEHLIQSYQQGNKELLNTIIENNLGLIHKALKSFKWAYNSNPKYEGLITYDDYYQQGALGLYSCIDSYNPDLGSFSNHAITYIKQYVYRFFYNNASVIRVPYEPRKDHMQLRRYEEQYIKQYGKEPTTKELSLFSGVPISRINELKQIFKDTISFNEPTRGDDSDKISIEDSIQDNTDYLDQTEKDIILKELRKDLVSMATISINDDAKINTLFYYFKNIDRKLVKDIAAELNLTSVQVNRIINDCVHKISYKFLDVLIERYSDIFSSSIRRIREEELMKDNVRNQIATVIPRMITLGDSLTVLDGASSNCFKDPKQVIVREIGAHNMKISYITLNYRTQEYDECTRLLSFSSIIDFRTENKKLVEITSKIGLN